jgi:hypothetical protein
MNGMETKKQLKMPYGISNFESLITNGYYYVDKTAYIDILEGYSEKYFTYLRPRGFGKSLFLSMLNYYYGSIYKDKFEQLFGNLHIGKNPSPLRNSYAVLNLDFSGINANSREEAVYEFSSRVRKCVSLFLSDYFPELEGRDKLPPVEAGAENILSHALTRICCERQHRKIYVLVDEYDFFANEILTCCNNNSLAPATNCVFVRHLYEKLKTFAGEGLVDRILITGVLPISLDGFSSGFNISTRITLEKDFHAMTGFTETEVRKLLTSVFPPERLEAAMADCKKWYNGYRFCKSDGERIFHPHMLLYFLSQVAETGEYPDEMLDRNMVNNYERVQKLFSVGDEKANLKELEKLFKELPRKSILVGEFSIPQRFSRENFISLLFYTGILTTDQHCYELMDFKIPNIGLEKLYPGNSG